MRRSYFEKVHYKKKKALKHKRNRKTFAADCIKKKGNGFVDNLNPLFVTNTKLIWETIKPFFSNETTGRK